MFEKIMKKIGKNEKNLANVCNFEEIFEKLSKMLMTKMKF